MSSIWIIFIGIFTGALGSAIPGILNTSILQITVKQGEKPASKFISGALLVIVFQTFLSVYFARFINKNPYVSDVINEIGIGVFLILSIYFFTKKTKSKPKKISQTKIREIMSQPFFYGILLAILNIFPILFYVFLSLSLNENSLFNFSLLSISLLSIGVTVGAYFAFLLYLWLGQQKKVNDLYVVQKIYPILGFLSLVIAGINAIKVFR